MQLQKNIAISESGFLFNPSSGDSFSINPIGNEVLQLLKLDKTMKEIIQEIEKKYDVERNMLEKDVEDFLNQLRENNLLNYDN